MSADTFRLPGGKTITLGRAIALGFANPDGTPTDSVPADSQAAKVLERERRAAEWRRTQGLDTPEVRDALAPALTRGQKAAATRAANRAAAAAGTEPDVTEDGKPKGSKKIEPLKPRNVDAEGNEVTDEETLARIAAEAEAKQAAAASDTPADGEGGGES